MYKILFLFGLLSWFGIVQVSAQNNPDIDKRNKTLFDQTVDKLNFRTIEFVYDRKFPRKKFPANQSDFKTRKTFDDFEGNAAFKKLFMNYNDVSEKFKNKFGKGKYDLNTFETALSDILINKDFEFFISSLNKDDKIILIKSLQQINKKGVAQFVDASGKPRGFFTSDSVIKEDPIVKRNNATAGTENVIAAENDIEGDTATAVINTAATPEEVFQARTPRRDWLSWIALLFSVVAVALAASVKLKDLPEVRNYIANNYQRKADVVAAPGKVALESSFDPTVNKKLDNLTREVEGLYAQMDELLHKNAVLEQKLAGRQHKPFDLPKTPFLEPEVEPIKPAKRENTVRTETQDLRPAAPTQPAPPVQMAQAAPNPGLTTPVNDSTHYSTYTVPQEPANTLAPTGSGPVTLFLAQPDPHGFFWNEQVSQTFAPNNSLFVLQTTGPDQRKGTFELINDPAVRKLALENQDLYLNPVCEIIAENQSGQGLEDVSPGTIILNGDQWVLVKKATLRMV